MDRQILMQLIDCLGRHDIFHTASAQGLDIFELRGSSPAVQLCADNHKNDWGAFDKLDKSRQERWINKARAGKAKVRRFWVTYFRSVRRASTRCDDADYLTTRPLSANLDMSIHVLDAILTRPIPHQIIPEPDLEDQVYGNVCSSSHFSCALYADFSVRL